MATLLDEVSRNVLRDGEKKLSKEVRVGPVSAVLLAEGMMYEMVWRGIDLSELKVARDGRRHPLFSKHARQIFDELDSSS